MMSGDKLDVFLCVCVCVCVRACVRLCVDKLIFVGKHLEMYTLDVCV